MPPLTTLPSWDALHPLAVHFPVALLLTAPLLVLAGLALPAHRRGLGLAALLVMVVGTAGAFLAVATGEAAEWRADLVPGAGAVLEEHEEHGEQARTVFTVLTLAWAGLLFLPALLRRRAGGGGPPAALHPVWTLAWLAAWILGLVLLVETAALGGRLVHELGVRGAGPAPAAPAAPDGAR